MTYMVQTGKHGSYKHSAHTNIRDTVDIIRERLRIGEVSILHEHRERLQYCAVPAPAPVLYWNAGAVPGVR